LWAQNINRPSTFHPQLFHSHEVCGLSDLMDNTVVLKIARWLWVPAALVLVAGPAAPAQAQPSLETFRIFLRDGRVLASSGEFARVDDDLVLVVTQGAAGGTQSHDLITVPVSRVDMERTIEYALAMRAAQYGATRGEREYLALTQDVARALAELEASDDKDRRLGIAQVARARLSTWSGEHFGYRAQELRQLVSLFDEVIVELQAATGITHFSLDFVADAAPSSAVPLMAAPSSVESVEMALVAAEMTDVGVERMSLLRSASQIIATIPDAPAALRARVASALTHETRIDKAYRALITDVVTRADTAVRLGLPASVSQLLADLKAGDARLGHLRPREMATALRRLEAEVLVARAQRTALDRWRTMEGSFRLYDARVRKHLRLWTGQSPVLAAIKSRRRVSPGSLEAALRAFDALDELMATLRTPVEMQDVHSVVRSAIQMARHGLLLGRRLAVAPNTEIAHNASAAIAGADLLRAQAVRDIAASIRPRTVR
jgi:hypothetical protein